MPFPSSIKIFLATPRVRTLMHALECASETLMKPLTRSYNEDTLADLFIERWEQRRVNETTVAAAVSSRELC